MDKAQAIHAFWSSFSLPAYDELTVPDEARLPYITYAVSTGNLDKVIQLSGSVWYHDTSWASITAKADEIARKVGYGYHSQKIDHGYMWITQGTPFAQRMTDLNPDIKRMYINLNAEFLTAY